MPNTTHIERHFQGKDTVRDIVIGMADGLTVPFALAAGLSGVVDTSHIIVIAGIAEIIAGSISMGLGGYLAAKGEIEHYDAEEKREYDEVEKFPEKEVEEVSDIFKDYGLEAHEITPITGAFKKDKKAWVDFMMRFELGLDKPDRKRTLKSARNIGLSYIAGGFVPLSPYMFISDPQTAMPISIVITLIILFIFGYGKGKFTGANPLHSALNTTIVGGIAAGAAYGIARLIMG